MIVTAGSSRDTARQVARGAKFNANAGRRQPPSPMEHATAAPPAPGVGAGALAASLEQIIGFFDTGMLTEAEFVAAKATVLGLASHASACRTAGCGCCGCFGGARVGHSHG